jgi:hypothetical protein
MDSEQNFFALYFCATQKKQTNPKILFLSQQSKTISIANQNQNQITLMTSTKMEFKEKSEQSERKKAK